MTLKLLLVDDEAPIREMLRFSLEGELWDVREAGDASQAALMIEAEKPDVILLDWMMPGMSGVEFAKRLKRSAVTQDIPIILLTARSSEDDKVMGLEAGADDYITKPFSMRELRARIQTVVKRARPAFTAEIIQVENLRLDAAAHVVSVQGEFLDLGPTEFRLLQFFMAHPERAYSREQLLNRVWGQNVYVEERTVDVHIRRLRKILATHSLEHYIQTVRTVGYRFSAKAESGERRE